MTRNNENMQEDGNGMDEALGRALGGALGGAPDGGCPSLEELALLAEDGFAGPERDRLLSHIADCADCREVYMMACEMAPDVDVAEVRQAPAVASTDTSAKARPATPSRPRVSSWQFRYLVPAALAASILVVVVTLPSITGRNKDVRETIARYAAAPLPADEAATDADKGREEARVPAPAPAPAPPAAARQDDDTPSDGTTLRDAQRLGTAAYGSRGEEGLHAKTDAPADGEAKTAKKEAPADARLASEPQAAPMLKTLPEREASGTGTQPLNETAKDKDAVEGGAGRYAVPSPPPPSAESRPVPVQPTKKRLYAQPMPESPRTSPPPPPAGPRGETAPTVTESAPTPARKALVTLDDVKKQSLGGFGEEVVDRADIERLFKDLKLGDHDFALKDVKKVVISWPGGCGPKAGADSDCWQALRGPARADVSLGDKGVLTIAVRKHRPTSVSVGC